jgi:hypothetical protein
VANYIHNEKAGPEYDIDINNGYTDSFISSLAVSGSLLASEPFEIDLITWICSRDQGVVGSGVVGFDIDEMPWADTEEVFFKQKEFLKSTIERAKSKIDQEILGYEINHTSVNFLSMFSSSVAAFKYEFVTGKKDWWVPPDPELRK